MNNGIELIVDDITFNEEKHEYRHKGKLVPSCTQIIAGVGLIDYGFIKKQVLEEKSALGDAVHLVTRMMDEGDLDVADLDDPDLTDPRVSDRVKGWVEFVNDWGFDSYAIERRCVVSVHGMLFGMTPDRLGEGNFGQGGAKQNALIDIKNTAEISAHHGVQLAGYCLPFKDDNPAPKRYVVQLLPEAVNGKRYKLHEFNDRNDERIFTCSLAITHWKANHGISL